MVHKEKQRDLDALIKSNLLANQFLKKTSLVLIWGASKGGERIAEKLIDKGFNVVGFIDRDFKKWGKNILERPVYGDHTSLPAIEYEYIVIATTPGRADAAAILDSLGKVFKKDYIYVW
ncbi:hypothetical protein OMP38_29940 [Cohnella ginsengisoli]|uniref:Uncharacterized protein n=1 Tax=Cohnella ginsengisoli TaxID=425004 RepID=A0A9X4KLV3_9BACL|nr:hypothetical protein [Cohnella ginsengisoli]MDG0794592.1 hypothetical protein [Cohnella ginsengisoli]